MIARDHPRSPDLLQALLFLTMEPPEDMSAAAILAAKVSLLKSVRTLDLRRGDAFLAQYPPPVRGCWKKQTAFSFLLLPW